MLARILAAVSGLLLVEATVHATLVFDLNTVDTISGSWTPAPGTSFGTATFKDHSSDAAVALGNVDLYLKAGNLGGGFITEWYFEIANSYNIANLQLLARTGAGYDVSGLTFQQVGTSANMKQYKLDFGFGFGLNPANRFDAGDLVTLTLGIGLSESTFNFMSEGNGYDGSGGVYTSMKVQGLPGDGSARVSDHDGYIPPVPEPATYVAGALLLIPMLVQARRW